ncbi:hypothetical protein ACFYUY_08550 [Kitasatospora sp. NPDC004745]|uniref:hypothetical protein n=1 Tax=unclassified Kitasatospora TaxID=2633591 RepID=UPI0033F25FBF
MTHRIENEVLQANRAAFTEACRYPDGTNVLCTAVLDLDDDGRIVRELGLQAWDG